MTKQHCFLTEGKNPRRSGRESLRNCMQRILIVENSRYVTGALKSIARFARTLSNEFEFHWAVTDAISDEDLKELIGSDKFHRFKFVEISKKPGRLIMYF